MANYKCKYDGLNSNSKLYRAWASMKSRCSNPNDPSYEWWECVILHDDINQFDTRRTDCPLIEIDQEDEEAVLFLARMRKAMREGKSLREFLDRERRSDEHNT